MALNFGMLSSTDIASPIEFPKASGIRIGAVSNKTDGKKFSLSYRVNLPAAMTGKGRVQKQFSSLCAAKDFASQQYQNARKHGHHVFSLTPDQLFDCSKALRLLEGADLRLEQIVEFALPKLKPEHEAVTVQQAVGLLLKAKSEMNLRDRTTKDLKIRLAKFCESFGNRSIAEVTAEDILDWIRCLGLAPRTRRNYYQTIRTLYSWAKDEKMIKEDPLALVPKSKLKHLFGKQDDKSPEIYTPSRKEQVGWVREKIPLVFGFCKRTFELKLPRFASACICHLLRKFLPFREPFTEPWLTYKNSFERKTVPNE